MGQLRLVILIGLFILIGSSRSFADYNSFTVNIPDAQGGYTSVIIKQSGAGYIGPNGEFYSQFPSVAQLETTYGGVQPSSSVSQPKDTQNSPPVESGIEKEMDAKLERDNYYKSFYPSSPMVTEIDAIINGTEYKPTGIYDQNGEYAVMAKNILNIDLEMGTKVISTVINWNIDHDRYINQQGLTIVDNQNQRQNITLDPSVRSYTDPSIYEGLLGPNNFIHGRQYSLDSRDKNLDSLIGGSNTGEVDINFRLKQYWGISSKPELTDEDIDNLNSKFITPLTLLTNYENLSPVGQYIYIITLHDSNSDPNNPPMYRIKEGEPAPFNVFQLPVFTEWELTVKDHTNAQGYTGIFLRV